MSLSPAGRKIKKKAELALEAVEAVQHQADQLKNDFRGKAHIGLNLDAQSLRVPDLLSVMTQKYSRLELHFYQRQSLEAPNQIRNGRLDAAFVFEAPTQPDFETKWLESMGIVIAGPYQWKNRINNVNLEYLTELPWIWTDHRCPFTRIADQLFESLNQTPVKVVVVDNETTIRKMVASGAGLCLMLESEAREAARQNQAVILGDRIAALDLSMIYLKKRSNDPLVQAVVKGVCDVWL